MTASHHHLNQMSYQRMLGRARGEISTALASMNAHGCSECVVTNPMGVIETQKCEFPWNSSYAIAACLIWNCIWFWSWDSFQIFSLAKAVELVHLQDQLRVSRGDHLSQPICLYNCFSSSYLDWKTLLYTHFLFHPFLVSKSREQEEQKLAFHQGKGVSYMVCYFRYIPPCMVCYLRYQEMWASPAIMLEFTYVFWVYTYC